MNRYEYAGSNPLARLDPFGLDWIYAQSTGGLYHLDAHSEVPATDSMVYIGKGYSGAGAGRNNSAMQNRENEGPIPQGVWTIGQQQTIHTSGGSNLPGAMRLTPRGGTGQYLGRSGGFLIHGGDFQTMDSSTGCIVLPPAVRNQIGNSGDTTLRVVP
jgi:hypothetical protein